MPENPLNDVDPITLWDAIFPRIQEIWRQCGRSDEDLTELIPLMNYSMFWVTTGLARRNDYEGIESYVRKVASEDKSEGKIDG